MTGVQTCALPIWTKGYSPYHPTWVWTITFSPDNNQILAGTQESVVRSWPTTIEAMSDEICGQIDRNLSKDEWTLFVSEDIEYEKTCENIPDSE